MESHSLEEVDKLVIVVVGISRQMRLDVVQIARWIQANLEAQAV